VSQSGIRTPRVSAPGAGGVKVKGGAAPAPWTTRETADEAAEAEAGEARVHALSSQHTRGEGTRKHACLPRGGKEVKKR